MNILLNSKNNYVLENDSSLKGQGWRPIYVAFRAMNFIPLKDENNLRLDSNEPLTFNLEITSNNVAKGELKIRNIYLCTDDFSY